MIITTTTNMMMMTNATTTTTLAQPAGLPVDVEWISDKFGTLLKPAAFLVKDNDSKPLQGAPATWNARLTHPGYGGSGAVYLHFNAEGGFYAHV
jgi:hypothetical protein